MFSDRRNLSAVSYSDDLDHESVNLEKSRKEAWMVNLRGGQDDAWLTGARNQTWFTGISPNNRCPGKCFKHTCQRISLKNKYSLCF